MPSSAANTKASNVTLECNYEKNCPPLYEAIESAESPEDFDRIYKFLTTGRWEGSLFSLGANPETQCRTWVTRFDHADATKVKWSQLPLHLAIVCGAPRNVIEIMIKLYPQALRCTDDQHMLPLHLALRHNTSDAIVAILVKEFPEAINAKGKNGRTAVECAQRAADGSRGVILNGFVEKTKSRISKTVLNERTALKTALEQKRTESAMLQSELEAQYTVIERLRGEMAKTRGGSEQMRMEHATELSDLKLKVQELQQSKDEIVEDLTGKLQKSASDKLVETMELQKKIDELKSECKSMQETHGKMLDTEMRLRKELDEVRAKVETSISNADWNKLKNEIASLKNERLQIARDETTQHLQDLKEELVKQQRSVGVVDKAGYAELKNTVDNLEVHGMTADSEEELESLRAQIRTLRADLKQRRENAETKHELMKLKEAMESQLRDVEGKTKDELAALKQAVAAADPNSYETKTNEQLAQMKQEMENLKHELTEKELFAKSRKESELFIDQLSATFAAMPDNAFKVEAHGILKTAEALNNHIQTTSNKDEIIAAKKELELVKENWKRKDISHRIHEEAAMLKVNIDDEIKKSQGKTQDELLQMKKSLQSLTDMANDKKSAVELARVREELANVKNDLKDLEKAADTQLELTVLKKSLAVQLQCTTAKAEREIADMKAAVDAIDMEHKEGKKLKKTLTEEIKKANGKNEKELLALKKALDGINLSKLESKNKDAWENMRKEMSQLKSELDEKRGVELSKTEKELAAMKKVLGAINVKDLEEKTTNDFQAIRNEMATLKSEISKKEGDEAQLKKALDDLKEQARQRSLKYKKDKAGVKKFLARRFSRKGGPRSIAGGGAAAKDSDDEDMKIDFSMSIDTSDASMSKPMSTLSPNVIGTILPPSMSMDGAERHHRSGGGGRGGGSDCDDNASNASDIRAAEMGKMTEEVRVILGSKTMVSPKKGMPPLPPKKTKSTPVRVDDPTIDNPIPMTRTWSRTFIKDNGEVELEVLSQEPSMTE